MGLPRLVDVRDLVLHRLEGLRGLLKRLSSRSDRGEQRAGGGSSLILVQLRPA